MYPPQIHLSETLKFRAWLGKIVATVFTASSGLCVGFEGPMVHLGAASGYLCSARLLARATPDQLKEESHVLNTSLSNEHAPASPGPLKALAGDDSAISHPTTSTAAPRHVSWADKVETEEEPVDSSLVGRVQRFMRGHTISFEKHSSHSMDFATAGAAAGIVAAFGTPMGGLMFVMEEVASFWSTAKAWRVFACCCTSAVVAVVLASWLEAWHPVRPFGLISEAGLSLFWLSERPDLTLPLMAHSVVLGLLGGVYGSAFTTLAVTFGAYRAKYITTVPRKAIDAIGTVGLTTVVFYWFAVAPCYLSTFDAIYAFDAGSAGVGVDETEAAAVDVATDGIGASRAALVTAASSILDKAAAVAPGGVFASVFATAVATHGAAIDPTSAIPVPSAPPVRASISHVGAAHGAAAATVAAAVRVAPRARAPRAAYAAATAPKKAATTPDGIEIDVPVPVPSKAVPKAVPKAPVVPPPPASVPTVTVIPTRVARPEAGAASATPLPTRVPLVPRPAPAGAAADSRTPVSSTPLPLATTTPIITFTTTVAPAAPVPAPVPVPVPVPAPVLVPVSVSAPEAEPVAPPEDDVDVDNGDGDGDDHGAPHEEEGEPEQKDAGSVIEYFEEAFHLEFQMCRAVAGLPIAANFSSQTIAGLDRIRTVQTTLFFANGEMVLNLLLGKAALTLTLPVVLAFLILYTILAASTAAISLSCGLLVPQLVMGASLGHAYGLMWAHIVPDSTLTISCAAVIGAAAVFGGISRMTFALAIMLVELTGSTRLMVCMMIAITLSKRTADAICHPIFEQLLRIKHVPLLPPDIPPKLSEPMSLLSAREVMSDTLVTIPVHATYADVYRVVTTTAHSAFPVVWPSGALVGLMPRWVAIALLMGGRVVWRPVGLLKAPPVRRITDTAGGRADDPGSPASAMRAMSSFVGSPISGTASRAASPPAAISREAVSVLAALTRSGVGAAEARVREAARHTNEMVAEFAEDPRAADVLATMAQASAANFAAIAAAAAAEADEEARTATGAAGAGDAPGTCPTSPAALGDLSPVGSHSPNGFCSIGPGSPGPWGDSLPTGVLAPVPFLTLVSIDALADDSLELRNAHARRFLQGVRMSDRVDLRPYVDGSPAVVLPTHSVERLYRTFRSCGLRHILVVDATLRPVGVITRKDLLPSRIEDVVKLAERRRAHREQFGEEML